MKLVVDTNIVLEIILNQDKASEARDLLKSTDKYEFFLSDYSLHSIGVLLFRRNLHDVFLQLLLDITDNIGIDWIALPSRAMPTVAETAKRFGLDFDDAYQHVIAKEHALTLVSFDKHFDTTELGRTTPARLLSD